MENFTTIYNEKEKIDNTFNAWEYYFEKINKYSLREVYTSKNVIITSNNFPKSFSHNIATKKFHKIFDKYLKIKRKLILVILMIILIKNYLKNISDTLQRN